jgi:PTS system mannitol-specific IIC component
MHAGLVATFSPGSIFTAIALAPKGGLLPVLCGTAAGAAVTFLLAVPMVRRFTPAEPGAEQFRFATEPASTPARMPACEAAPSKILFVCEAGMGSSAIGAAVMRRRLEQAGLRVPVEHCALTGLPRDAEIAICQRSLADRVKQIAPQARVFPVDDYIRAPAYEEVVRVFLAVRRR